MLFRWSSFRLFFAGVAVLCGLFAVPSIAAAGPVGGCSFEDDFFQGRDIHPCDWTRAGDGKDSGSTVVVVRGDGSLKRVVGYLPRGRYWIHCQEKGATVHNSAGENYWYGLTRHDQDGNGSDEWGWVSALDVKDGHTGGWFGEVNNCPDRLGPAPGFGGRWPPRADPPPSDGTAPDSEAPQAPDRPSPQRPVLGPQEPTVRLAGPRPADRPSAPRRCLPPGPVVIPVALAAQEGLGPFDIRHVRYETFELRVRGDEPEWVRVSTAVARLQPPFRARLSNPHRPGSRVVIQATVRYTGETFASGDALSRTKVRMRICPTR